MNAFLLVTRMNMDELPLRLFATEEEFDDFMLRSKGTLEDLIEQTGEALKWPASDLVCLDLVEFKDGVPVSSRCVMEFDHDVSVGQESPSPEE